MSFDRRPLAVLRLTQSIKNIQRSKTEEQMLKAAELIKQGNTEDAELLQSKLVTSLLDSEFSVRLSGAYSSLIKSRDELRSILKSQTSLLKQCVESSNKDFQTNLGSIHKSSSKTPKRINLILLQSVLPPRPKLMDENCRKFLPFENLENAEIAMKVAVEQISSGKRDAVLSSQTNALDSLRKLSNLVDQWSVELGLRTLGLSTLVTKSSDRASFIEKIEAKVVALWDKTDEAALDEKMSFPLPRSNIC